MSAEDQINRLKTVAADHGWMVAGIFSDRPMPVTKGREKRPGEAALLDAIRDGGVQKVLAFGIDRVGRSLVELVGFFETCRTAGVSLWLDEQKLDTAGSNGMSLFDVGGMLAFHLRQSRRDRILRRQAAARSASVRFGRPKLIDIKPAKVQRAMEALEIGTPVRKVARMTGISPASISRLKGTMA